MKKLLLLFLAIATGMVNANAADDLYLRTDFKGVSKWGNDVNGDDEYKFTYVKTDADNQDVYTYVINASDIKTKDIWFRLYIPGWGAQICPYTLHGSYTFAFENGQNETYGAKYEQTDFQGSDPSFGISHSTIKANQYKITVYRGNNKTNYQGDYCKVMWIRVDIVDMPVKITSAGYATFSSNYALDFSDKDIIPSSATVSNGKITYTQQTTVPAGEGVLLKRKDGQLAEATANVPVIEKNQATPFNGNHFVAIPEKTQLVQCTEAGYTNYILSKVNDEIGFYKVNSAGSWVNGGTAYLKVHTGTGSVSARSYFPLVDEAATSIESIKASQNDSPIFNLADSRLLSPQRDCIS